MRNRLGHVLCDRQPTCDYYPSYDILWSYYNIIAHKTYVILGSET